MNWVRILLSFILGMTVLGALQNFFHLNIWVSAAIAMAATLVTWIEKALAVADKALDVRKKSLEIRKLEREQEESRRIVKLATPGETQEHGMSWVERELRSRSRSKTQEALNPKPFISETHEDNL